MYEFRSEIALTLTSGDEMKTNYIQEFNLPWEYEKEKKKSFASIYNDKNWGVSLNKQFYSFPVYITINVNKYKSFVVFHRRRIEIDLFK